MEQGRWVKLNTNIAEWRWAHKPEYMAFVTWCLILANPRPHAFEKMMLERGQFATSLSALSAKIGCTIRTLRTVIRDCEECGFISKKTTHKNTIITVCNYDSYQDSKKQNDTQTTRKRHTDDTQTTRKRHTDDTQTTLTLEYKNKDYKNKETRLNEDWDTNVSSSLETTLRFGTPDGFAENSRKSGEKEADEPTLPLIAESPEKEKNCAKKEKGDGIDFAALKEFFNAQMRGRGIPPISTMTPKRQQAVAARCREHGKEAIAKAITNAANSKFLNAETDGNFCASFDWIFRPTNFVKVLEGNYNIDRAPTPRPAKLSGAGSAIQAYETLTQFYEQQNGNNTDNGGTTDAATEYLASIGNL